MDFNNFFYGEKCLQFVTLPFNVPKDVLRAVASTVDEVDVGALAHKCDYITVQQIADLAVEVAGLDQGSVEFEYTGGNRGWKGDVPVVRLNSDRIRSLGWRNQRTCREALRDSLTAMLVDARQGRFDD